MKKQTSLLLTSFLLAVTALAEVRIEVEELNGHIQMTLSGTANTAGLTPETRSSAAFLGASGWLLGLPPLADPTANLQSYQVITLDLYPSEDIMTPAPDGLLDNWLRDPTLSYTATTDPIGFFFGDNFETLDPIDTFGELYLPASYTSGADLSGSLVLSNQTLATFGLTIGDQHTFGWNSGTDTLTFQVIPEPTVFGLVLLSSGALFGIRRIKFSTRFYRDTKNDRIPHEPIGTCR